VSVEANERAATHAAGKHEEPSVEVVYNGLRKKVDFKFSETMGALRLAAMSQFGNVPSPHALSLFTRAGVEFGPDKDQLTAREAGIRDHEELLLRPGIVRGGG
jgi:hypothetical protein